jgi:PTS system mannose-specific IIB component
MISVPLIWTRVDQKLIHGQVSAAWVPYLGVDAIVVSDYDSAGDSWAQKVMMMGLPPEIRLTVFCTPDKLPEIIGREDLQDCRVMLLFKNLEDALAAVSAGLRLERLNLGNQACRVPERDLRLADSFYACRRDLEELGRFQKDGLEVIVQSVPGGKAVKWTS